MPGSGPGQPQLTPGAGQPDIHQAALFLDCLRPLRHADRDQAFAAADQEHGVPLQALCGMQRSQRDALDRRGMPGCRPLIELAHDVSQPRRRMTDHDVVSQPNQRLQGLPAIPGRPTGARRPLGPPGTGDHIADELTKRLGTVICSGRTAHQKDGPANLLAGEKSLAPADEVGKMGVGERGLVGLGLGVRAKEDRDLTCRRAASDQLLDRLGHTGCLRGVVTVCRQGWLGAVLALRPELEDISSGSGGLPVADPNQDVGKGNDLRGRPVVANQLDHLGVWVTAWELQQVPGRGAGEGVDRLGCVPDHTDVVALTHPQIEKSLLKGVDVLVLVNHEVAVLRAHDASDVLTFREDADGQQQHVLEVNGPSLSLDLLVGL